jgi:phage tail-like protein
MARQLRGLAGCDQWIRATHTCTTVDGETGLVSLSWQVADIGVRSGDVESDATRGLAFDRFCRGYRGTATNVERTLFGPSQGGVDYARIPAPLELLAEPIPSDPEPQPVFGPTRGEPARESRALIDTAGIAVDADDRLIITERGRRRLVVIDLWSRRVVRVLSLAGPAHPRREPWGLAVDGHDIWVVTQRPAGLLRLTARGEPTDQPLPAPSVVTASGLERRPLDASWQPERVAIAGGEPLVLFRGPAGNALLVGDGAPPVDVDLATDLATDAEGAIVVAPAAGARSLSRFMPRGLVLVPTEPLDAAGYDGGGIALTQDGRIAYTAAAGLRLAIRGRLRYESEGRVITFRLDSGSYGTRWGRIFLDANVPNGTALHCTLRTSDDEDATAISHAAADPAGCDPYRPDLSPALPPPRLDVPVKLIAGSVQARITSPVPWWRRAADDCLTTYEGFPDAAPGRYAWLALRLTGNSRATPRIGDLRIEAESHTLMRRLPNVFSLDPTEESFLHRYLALFDGTLHDLDQRALLRDLLLDPHSTPEEALSWLASFVGLVLDERWPVAARRQLLAEAATLFRLRGTVGALSRYLQLYLGVVPVIVEHYRLRGLGGPVLSASTDPGQLTRSVLGFGFRVGGAVGDAEVDADAADDSFRTHAHRFSVLIPRLLDPVEEQVVRLILDRERPGHTAYELCTVDAGMRVGRSMHLGLTSVIGRTGGFTPAVLGQAALGGQSVLGVAVPGGVVEAAHVGQARVG